MLASLELQNIYENNQLRIKRKAVPQPVMCINSTTGTQSPLSNLQKDDINKQKAKEQLKILIITRLKKPQMQTLLCDKLYVHKRQLTQITNSSDCDCHYQQ